MIAFGGIQRSYSWPVFHADIISNSIVAVDGPSIHCELACFQNDPDSTGNIVIGSDRLSYVGNGIILEPGDVTGWIPIINLNLIWHIEEDATTYLRYMIIGHPVEPTHAHLLLEDHNHMLLEDGFRISLV